jgi:hypothetical protein
MRGAHHHRILGCCQRRCGPDEVTRTGARLTPQISGSSRRQGHEPYPGRADDRHGFGRHSWGQVVFACKPTHETHSVAAEDGRKKEEVERAGVEDISPEALAAASPFVVSS